MNKKTKLIALDTSSSSTGFSVYVGGVYNNSGTIDLKKEKSTGITKLTKMCKLILDYLIKENPDIIVVEETVVTRNAQAQRSLTMILGVIFSWCICNDCDYVSIRPTEWRKLISDEKKGRGRDELKEWSINKVKQLFGLELNDDEADAILIGLAWINKCK